MTKKPCPGCGKVYSRRKADQVCHDCRALMQDGQKFRDETARDESFEFVLIPHQYYALPHLGRDDDQVQKSFYALVAALCKPASNEIRPYGDGSKAKRLFEKARDDHSKVFRMPKPFPDLLRDLLDKIKRFSNAARREGRQDGQSIVLALARGETTIDDWNKATTTKDDDE